MLEMEGTRCCMWVCPTSNGLHPSGDGKQEKKECGIHQ